MFEVKDRKSTEIQDFDVFIDEKQVALKDDKKTTKNAYTFNAKLKFVVKKLGFSDSTETELVVGAEQPNKIQVQLVSYQLCDLDVAWLLSSTFQDPTFATCKFSNGKGVVFIRETGTTTEIYGEIKDLEDGLHPLRIHEFGDLENGCSNAGGHFDPDEVLLDRFSFS